MWDGDKWLGKYGDVA